MTRRISTIIFFALLSCHFSTPNQVTLHTHQGAQKISIEIADTPREREHGLMGRTDLPDNHGMLFIWPYAVSTSFWMKDTPLSLDMLFIDHDKKIVFIAPATIPYSDKLITPDKEFQYVLEVKAGFSKKNGVKVGDVVGIGF